MVTKFDSNLLWFCCSLWAQKPDILAQNRFKITFDGSSMGTHAYFGSQIYFFLFWPFFFGIRILDALAGNGGDGTRSRWELLLERFCEQPNFGHLNAPRILQLNQIPWNHKGWARLQGYIYLFPFAILLLRPEMTCLKGVKRRRKKKPMCPTESLQQKNVGPIGLIGREVVYKILTVRITLNT